MSSAPRKIFITLLVIVVLAGAALYVLTSNLNGIVAGLIEKQGSAATQTAVRVSGIDIKLGEASAALEGLTVGNPDGFSGNAIELGGFSVQLDASSLAQDTIVIRDISVDGARINLRQEGASNNLKMLLDNLQGAPGEEPANEAGSGKRIIIERFTLNDASASVSLPDLDEEREVSLETFTLRDIGRATNGATGAQVAQQILQPLMEKALSSAAADSIKERASEKIGEAVGDLLKKVGKD